MKKLNLFALGLVSIGLVSCASEDDTNDNDVADQVVSETYTLDTESSVITWTGDYFKGGEFDHNHIGIVLFNSGTISMTDGSIESGSFELDMTTLDEPDAPMGEEARMKFIGHLKSDDYFDVENHPTATVNLSKSTSDKLVGTITVKGIDMPFEAPATITVGGDAVKITGDFNLNFAPFDMEGIGSDADPEYVSPNVAFKIALHLKK